MRVATLVVTGIILILVVGLGTVAIAKVRAAADKIDCNNHLKQIGLAISNYHDTYNRFPPAAKPNPDLAPEKRLSWLYCIMPWVESGSQYHLFDNTKAWDAEENRCWGLIPGFGIYQCPSYPDRPPDSKFFPTHYLGIAGVSKNAAELLQDDPKAGLFGYERKVSLKDITDDHATTMMVVETAWSSGAWTAGGPSTVRGLDTEASPYLGVPGYFGGNHPGGANVLFADGSVHFVKSSLDPRIFEAMATISGGEDLSRLNWGGF